MNYAQAGQHGTIGGTAAANLQQAVSNLAPPTKRDTLQAAVADFQGQIQQLDAIADRLEGLTGRIRGVPPSSVLVFEDKRPTDSELVAMITAACEIPESDAKRGMLREVTLLLERLRQCP